MKNKPDSRGLDPATQRPRVRAANESWAVHRTDVDFFGAQTRAVLDGRLGGRPR